MNLANHCRKTSLQYQMVSPQAHCLDDNQLCFVRSLKESPQVDKMFWLRATHHERNQRYHSDEKSQERMRARKEPFATRRTDHFISNNNVAKTRPLLKFHNICLESGLYIVQTALKECHSFHHRLGYSYFDVRNCQVDEKGRLVINPNNLYSQAQTHTTDETTTVRDIIESVHKICAPKCFDDFYSYYKRSSAKCKCTFKYALSLVQSYSMCSKIAIVSVVRSDEPEDRYEHPKSTERVSPFMPSMFARRKSTSKTNRDSFYVKLFDNRSQQKMESNRIQRAIPVTKKNSKSQAQTITIQSQYNVVVNPVSQYAFKSGVKSETKTSSVSTNFKSSHHHGDSLEMSTVILRHRLSRVSNKTNENKEAFSFLPADLDEVQSLGESSDHESHLPARRFDTPRDEFQQNIKKENEERILTINNWTRRLNGLLEEERDLKLSINEDMDKENYRHRDSLKKLVRTVAESILPIPSQFLIRNS